MRMSEQEKKALVPALRFPEFRGVGEWKEHKLEKLASFSKGKGISKSDVVADGKQPCIRYGELYTLYNETIKNVSSYTNVSADNLVLSKANDVIIPASGETQEDIATASCVINSDIALGGDLNIIRSKMDGVFLSYYLNSSKKKSIAQLSQGISVVHLYSSQLKKLDICIPEPEEQQKIANCLSSLDELIRLQTQKRDALKAHKKGLMQQLFPATGETQPKLRFPEFRGKREWEGKPLGSVCSSISSGKNKNEINSVYDLYGSTGVIGKTSSATFSGDFILAARVGANAGLLTRASGQFGVTDNTLVIFLNTSENIDFIYYSLDQIGLNKMVFGSGQPLITGKQLKNLGVNFPAPDEQRKIADCLSSLDALIATQSQKIDAIKSHKKGLMQQLFPSMDDDCMEEVRPGAGRKAGLGHAGGRAMHGAVAEDAKAEVGA